VGGGTGGNVTTDYFGNGDEVMVTKSDSSKVEIHLDSSFDVMGPPGGAGRNATADPVHQPRRCEKRARTLAEPRFSLLVAATGREREVPAGGRARSG